MIAERILKLNVHGKMIDLPVRIHRPEKDKASWSCRYEIRWPDGGRTATAHGVDSVQSILVALQMIGAELYTSDHHKAGRLVWDEAGRGYGFPLTQNIRGLLIDDDAKYL